MKSKKTRGRKLKQFVLYVDKWLRRIPETDKLIGKNEESFLYSPYTKDMCCIGQLLNQCHKISKKKMMAKHIAIELLDWELLKEILDDESFPTGKDIFDECYGINDFPNSSSRNIKTTNQQIRALKKELRTLGYDMTVNYGKQQR